jgi:hypothetical protein
MIDTIYIRKAGRPPSCVEFSIGHQTFTLQPPTAGRYETELAAELDFYVSMLEIAFTKLPNITVVKEEL